MLDVRIQINTRASRYSRICDFSIPQLSHYTCASSVTQNSPAGSILQKGGSGTQCISQPYCHASILRAYSSPAKIEGSREVCVPVRPLLSPAGLQRTRPLEAPLGGSESSLAIFVTSRAHNLRPERNVMISLGGRLF
jgi:hypothetical protein